MDELEIILQSKRLSQGLDPRTGAAFETREKQIMVKSPVLDWKRMPEGREKYNAYLASREWAVLKEKVKERSRGVCERCAFAKGEQVHHQTYERKYRERLEDLLHVCRPCHEFVSGITNDDPIFRRPLMMKYSGDPLVTLYLAGKITGTKWRDEIFPAWSTTDGAFLEDDSEVRWSIRHRAVATNDIRKLSVSGPWWTPGEKSADPRHGYPETYDKTQFASEANGGNPHASCFVNQNNHCAFEVPETLWGCIKSAICEASLLFAWIDSYDCYGTILEIGFANCTGTKVCIAHPPGFELGEMWLLRHAANFRVYADGPGEAWKKFLSSYTH